jgi:NAD(P)H-dependent FMN reductase
VSKPVLQIIIGSTRPGRVGPSIATWFYDLAVADGSFEVELVDLAKVNLPLFDEPKHPLLRSYEHEHTKKWSQTIARADAIVFVIPEYNHSYNAATKNAIDYLNHEWRYKSLGLVSYGGVAMGVRAIQALKPIFMALRLFYCGEVTIPLPTVPVVDGVFSGNDVLNAGAKAILKEIADVAPALKTIRDAHSS